MNLPLNKNGNIELDLYDIMAEVIGNATEEEMDGIIERFTLLPEIRRYMVDRLANEYSRYCYYEEIHKDRLSLLTKIKEEELNFYASLIADKVADEYRHNKAYWELYHWCSDKGYTHEDKFPHQALKPCDWDWIKGIEKIVVDTVKKERPSLLEVKNPELLQTACSQDKENKE